MESINTAINPDQVITAPGDEEANSIENSIYSLVDELARTRAAHVRDVSIHYAAGRESNMKKSSRSAAETGLFLSMLRIHLGDSMPLVNKRVTDILGF